MTELRAEKRQFMKNVSWLVVAKSVPSAANVIEMIVLARVFGVELFGLLTLVIAYVKIVSSLVDFRVWESVVKYVGEFLEKNESERALSMIKFSYVVDVVTGLLAFGVCLLLAVVANDILIKSQDGFDLVMIFSFTLIVASVNTKSQALFEIFISRCRHRLLGSGIRSFYSGCLFGQEFQSHVFDVTVFFKIDCAQRFCKGTNELYT